MEYLSYSEYLDMGGVLDSAAFVRYSTRVFARIRQETSGRVDKMSSVPKEVKCLTRDMVEYLFYNVKPEKAVTGASQAQGGASESESYHVKTQEEVDNDIRGMIFDYLLSVVDDFGTPLLYRGCRA